MDSGGWEGTYHDFSLGLLKLVLVGDALELVALLDESGVFHLDHALLVHDLGDLFRHHLRHLFSHVVFQQFQVVQFFIHLSPQQTQVSKVALNLPWLDSTQHS